MAKKKPTETEIAWREGGGKPTLAADEAPVAEPKKKRKKSSKSPTQRALAHCKKQGWTAAIVERWNQWAGVRQDLFGFIDLVVLDGLPGPLGLQVTSRTGVGQRREKIDALPNALRWLESGARTEIWTFSKKGARGKRKAWELRRTRGVLRDGKIEWLEEDGSHTVAGAPALEEVVTS